MSLAYVILLAISGLSISLIAAAFSVIGLAKLFAGSAIAVGVMASALEFAKLVSAGFLYRYWKDTNFLMRSYLTGAIIVLSGITSMGIFGYLSSAYQRTSQDMKISDQRLATLEGERVNLEKEMKRIQAYIDEVPPDRIARKIALQREAEPHLRSLQDKINQNLADQSKTKVEALSHRSEVGPIIYVADSFDAPVDSVAKIFILLFVLIFDPLAIVLVIATSMAIKIHEVEKKNAPARRDDDEDEDQDHADDDAEVVAQTDESKDSSDERQLA
ncbi:MAG: hypothetical protein KF767_16955 [Bdellovibrionaceae bacterium]|nr:hypothetical protein [Pseudobdellovibrionaceae bacterium]